MNRFEIEGVLIKRDPFWNIDIGFSIPIHIPENLKGIAEEMVGKQVKLQGVIGVGKGFRPFLKVRVIG